MRTPDQRRDRGRVGTPVPDLSIEVDDLDEVHRRIIDAGLPIEYARRASRGASAASTFATRSVASSTSSSTPLEVAAPLSLRAPHREPLPEARVK